MDPKDLSPVDKITTCQNMLDSLVEAQGRAKCGYIYIINEILEALKVQVSLMEEDLKGIANQNGIETE